MRGYDLVGQVFGLVRAEARVTARDVREHAHQADLDEIDRLAQSTEDLE